MISSMRALFIFAALSSTVLGALAADCSKEELLLVDSLGGTQQLRCRYLLGGFDVCDDTCSTHFNTVAEKAPDCIANDSKNVTKKMDADDEGKKCEDARASTVYKYVPILSPGLGNCTASDKDKWRLKFNYTTAYGKCTVLLPKVQCSDSCVKSFEQGIDEAPMCLTDGDYSFREYEKKFLIKCLKVRGEDLKTNVVLQSKTDSSSSSSAATTTAPAASANSGAMHATLGALVALGSAAVL